MMSRPIIAACAAIPLLLAACSQPTSSSDPNANARQGAIAGALLGGIAGLSSNDDKVLKGAVGAAIGGAVGGAIGQRLDQQAADLRSDLGNDQVKIVNTGSELVVTMPQDILFATDSATVQPGLQADLRTLAYNLARLSQHHGSSRWPYRQHWFGHLQSGTLDPSRFRRGNNPDRQWCWPGPHSGLWSRRGRTCRNQPLRRGTCAEPPRRDRHHADHLTHAIKPQRPLLWSGLCDHPRPKGQLVQTAARNFVSHQALIEPDILGHLDIGA